MRFQGRVAGVIAMVLALGVSTAEGEPLWRESPGDAVRRHVDEMLTLARDPRLDPVARHVAARNAAARAVDFAELSRRALGRHWTRMSGSERKEFLEGVRGIVTQGYVGRLARHLGDRPNVIREHVRVLDESVSGDTATVALTIRHAGQEIPVEAALSRYRATWRICDLAIYGVRVSENMTAQVTRLARDGRYGEVLARLADRRAMLSAAKAR